MLSFTCINFWLSTSMLSSKLMQFFNKWPFGNLQLQNGCHKKFWLQSLPLKKNFYLSWLKDCTCNNNEESENEETVISGRRNDLLQSCWDSVINNDLLALGKNFTWFVSACFWCKASWKLEIPSNNVGIKILMKTCFCFHRLENILQ